MKIKCSKDSMIENINIVSKAISSRSTMPILSCVLLSAWNDFRLTASESDLCIETSPINAQIIETGHVALEAKIFFEIIRKMPGNDIEIRSDKKNVTLIKCGKTEFKILGMDGDEYPVLPDVEKNDAYVVKANELKEMIRQTIFSVSIDDSKPVQSGELLEFKNNTLNVVSSDSFRISHRKQNATYIDDINAVVPSKTLNELSRILPDEDVFVNIYFTDKHVLFQLGNATVVSRLLAGDFINYALFFLNDCTTMVHAERMTVLSALDRSTLISSKEGKKNPVKLKIENDSITITSNTEMGTSYEEIYVETNGEPLEIHFNPKYLMDALRAIEDDRIVMQFTTALSPCIIRSIEADSYEYLIVPLQIFG